MVNLNATLIAQILNFLFLVFVLAKFAYKPLLNIMEERKNKIAADLEAADAAKAEAEAVKSEYAAKLADARQEAQAIVEAARKSAQAAHDKIMAETKAEQDQVVAAAKEAIKAAKEAQAELKLVEQTPNELLDPTIAPKPEKSEAEAEINLNSASAEENQETSEEEK